jgi:hypothetical protein
MGFASSAHPTALVPKLQLSPLVPKLQLGNPCFSSSSLPWRLKQSFKDSVPKLELGNE